MLDRDLDRIASQLTNGILATLRAASVDELAELFPAVRKLVSASRAPASRAAAPARSAGKPVAPVAGPSGAALAESILRVLGKSKEGMRSEELQSSLRVSTLPLRAALASLHESGKVKRTGQARGTRYSVAGRAVTFVAPAEKPEIQVSVPSLNGIRAHLASSTVPLSFSEIQERASLGKDETRAALEKLIELGFAGRQGHGARVRYQLATRSSDSRSAAGEAPRVVRRPPRAKVWTTTEGNEERPHASPADAQSHSEPHSHDAEEHAVSSREDAASSAPSDAHALT
jgi:hypothetical protein